MNEKVEVYQKEDYFIIIDWTTEMALWMVENTPSVILEGVPRSDVRFSVKITFEDEADKVAFKLRWF